MQNRVLIQIGASAILMLSTACSDGDDPNPVGSSGEVDAAAQPGSDGGGEATPADIVDTAVAAGSFTTLAKALTDTGLVDTLRGDGPFTVFAPTDDAFAALPAGTLESLTNEQLAEILLYHVVAGEARSTDLDGSPVATVSGYTAFVDLSDGVRINGANVTAANVDATNGVIHVIDKVILPPNLVDAALLAGSFSTLAGALTPDLVDTLSNDGPFTVFAPTDNAFAALDAGVLEGMDTDTLVDVLTYHVVAGQVLSTDLSNGPVPTLQGGTVDVNLSSGVQINGANVVIADVVTTNGVIHAIDGVLTP